MWKKKKESKICSAVRKAVADKCVDFVHVVRWKGLQFDNKELDPHEI